MTEAAEKLGVGVGEPGQPPATAELGRTVAIPAADWDRFEAWMTSPAKDAPALRELAAHRPAWRD